MSIFKRKPRCPRCFSREHSDPDYHNQEMDKLLRQAQHEIKMLKSAQSLEEVQVTLQNAQRTASHIRSQHLFVDVARRGDATLVLIAQSAERRKWQHVNLRPALHTIT